MDTFSFSRRGRDKICFAYFLACRPWLSPQYPASHHSAKKASPGRFFFTLRALSGFESLLFFENKKGIHFLWIPFCFQGEEGIKYASHISLLADRGFRHSTRLRTTPLKKRHSDAFSSRSVPSQASNPFYFSKTKKASTFCGYLFVFKERKGFEPSKRL